MHLWERVYERRERKAEPLTSLYWNIFLRGMGMNLVGLFTPVFIFLIGQQNGGLIEGLRLVAWYLIIQRLLLTVMTIPIARVVDKLGFRLSVLLGSGLTVFYYLLPTVFDDSIWLVVGMALVTSFSIPFYWLSRHSMLALDGEKDKMGKEVGMMNLLERGGAVLAPMVGGILAQVFGFKMLFGVGVMIILFSSLPLFFMQHHGKKGGVEWKDIKMWLGKEKRHLLFASIGEGLDGVVSGFFWPVYIFLAVGSLEVLGGLVSATMLVSLLATFFAGRIFDKQRLLGGNEDENNYWLASGLMAVLRVARAMFGNLIGVFGVDLLTKIVAPFYWVPFGGYLYSAGKDGRSLRFYAVREIIYSLTIVILGGMLLWISMYWWRWWGIFGLSSVGILLTMKLAKES